MGAERSGQSGRSSLGPLLVLRTLTVANDNVLRWLAIGLGKKAVTGGQMALVLTIGTAGFVLPFVALAWLAGWLADRYPKRSVIIWCKLLEIVIAAAAAAAVAWGVRSGTPWQGLPGGLWLLLATVIAIGCQAALMAPSVIGTIPESVSATRLPHANGLFAAVTLAATLVGMALGNWLADATVVPGSDAMLHSAPPWLHALPAALAVVGLAVAGWLAAIMLVHRPAADPAAPPPWNALKRTWQDLYDLCIRRELAAAAAGIVFFWALGAVAQLNVDQYATEAGATSQGQVVPLLVALVSGIGLGSIVAGRLSSRGADMGLVPAGAILMTLASLALALGPREIFAAGGGPAWGWAVGALAVLGLGAGIFDVPLEAAFQAHSPPERRGGLLSAANLLTFAGMFAASMLYGLLRTPWATTTVLAPGEVAPPLVTARGIFGIFAVLAAAASAAAIYAAPRASLRLFVATIVHAVWRFRVRGLDNVPREGPVVLVANHLSWLDGFLMPMSCHRPVRMVVYGPNIQGRFLRMLSEQWRFILFDPRPKSIGQALKTIQAGLAAGDVIGIFCEGGISRTGQILGFKRGLEWLLARVEAPIVPVHIDGMWGSGLSFSEGRYFTKWPRLLRRSVTLTYGRPLPVGTPPDVARLALQELTAVSVGNRMLGAAGPGGAAARATAEAFDGCCLIQRTDRMLASLAPGDALHDSLGQYGGELLGIRGIVVEAATEARVLLETIEREKITVWLARADQVGRVAAADAVDALPAALAAVVMPIGAVGELVAAEAAALRFKERFGIQPVVAFAPSEVGGLVAMNSPPGRATANHEVTLKAGSLGRVVNGVVVWPQAALRRGLGLAIENPESGGDETQRTLVIAATAPQPHVNHPRAIVLAADLDVDQEGFLIVKGGG